MSMGRSSTEKNFCLSFFIESLSKNILEVGDPKIDDFGPFFKNRCPKFLPTAKKNVFGVAYFFEKSRKCGVILGGAP